MSAHDASHGSGGHVSSVGLYVLIFVVLLAFTGITTAVAFVDLGPFNNVVAIGIAVLKATLVILFFMHMKYSTRMVPLVFLAGLFGLVLLLGITFADYVSRGWLGVAGR
jgi:cytochrome c oxidase subunit 4